MQLRTPDKPEVGAYHIDAPSMRRRLKLLRELAGPTEPVLFVGDDDLACLALSLLGYRDLTLLDNDPELLEIVARHGRGRVKTQRFDLRRIYEGKRPRLPQRFKLFVTDPPYGPDGLRVFTGVGLSALQAGGLGVVVYPTRRAAQTSVAEPDELAQKLQRFVLDSGSVIVDVKRDSQRSYHGTGSSMLVVKRCTKEPIAFSQLEGPDAFL
jgi:predicted methyltransferase